MNNEQKMGCPICNNRSFQIVFATLALLNIILLAFYFQQNYPQEGVGFLTASKPFVPEQPRRVLYSGHDKNLQKQEQNNPQNGIRLISASKPFIKEQPRRVLYSEHDKNLQKQEVFITVGRKREKLNVYFWRAICDERLGSMKKIVVAATFAKKDER